MGTSLNISVIGRYNQPLAGPNGQLLNVTSWTTRDVQVKQVNFSGIKHVEAR